MTSNLPVHRPTPPPPTQILPPILSPLTMLADGLADSAEFQQWMAAVVADAAVRFQPIPCPMGCNANMRRWTPEQRQAHIDTHGVGTKLFAWFRRQVQ